MNLQKSSEAEPEWIRNKVFVAFPYEKDGDHNFAATMAKASTKMPKKPRCTKSHEEEILKGIGEFLAFSLNDIDTIAAFGGDKQKIISLLRSKVDFSRLKIDKKYFSKEGGVLFLNCSWRLKQLFEAIDQEALFEGERAEKLKEVLKAGIIKLEKEFSQSTAK